MKRFSLFLIIIFALCSLSISAFAEVIQTETGKVLVDTEEAIESDSQGGTVFYQENLLSDNPQGDLVSATSSVYSVTASNTTGLKSIVLNLIGDYETVVTDYEYRAGSSSYTSHSIDIQPDYAWLCSFGIFALVIYCVFRLGGAFIG